jgi:diguanylate cyclase (GGDEF)-like protein/PAS domain S-box-containing protein
MPAVPPPPGGRDVPSRPPPPPRAPRGARRRLALARGLRDRLGPVRLGDGDLAGILDLLEEHVYSGEITPSGHYVNHASGPTLARFLGGDVPDGIEGGRLWESRVHPDDWAAYEHFNERLLAGEDAEATYRLLGLDGVTRVLWDRARPRRRDGGGSLVVGIVSDVTSRREAASRLADATDRFTRLLDVVGEHVYLALAHPDGSIEELFQGPGADRLLGGAEPDAEMRNWEAALHPDDRAAYDAFNLALARGEGADVEYRLTGADGVTRWVHDRAATQRRADGSIEVSGIVSDVTERRRMRAELARAHAALSQVVEAMDAHLYTLRVDADGCRPVYRGPNREVLVGGPLADGDEGERTFESLVHPEDGAQREAALARLAEGGAVDLEYRVVGLDGRERIVADRLRPRRDHDGALFFDGVTRDVTERRQLEAELRSSMAQMQEAHHELERARGEAERRARTDELTGACNRRHFAEIVGQALADGPAGCGLLLVDADHFKQVNDAYGHLVGDAVLVEFTRRLSSALGADDRLARWGGEEFAVLLRGVGSQDELARRAERLRSVVAGTPIAAAGVSLPLTASLGAVRAGGELDSLDALVEAADRCLYVAKRRGRNCVSLVQQLEHSVPADEPEAVCMARALAAAACARVGAPMIHAEQVSVLATLTAERLGLPVGIALRCRLGGWLHDVGKVAIPQQILDKPEPLEPADWTLMRTHPAVGENMVRGVGALREAAAAVRHHHERYDGEGYPDRLAGAAIPIEARVVAAADAYAAMTADRPYSAARTPAEAALELRRSAGTHLDPDVVEALLAVLDLAAAPRRRAA